MLILGEINKTNFGAMAVLKFETGQQNIFRIFWSQLPNQRRETASFLERRISTFFGGG
jgi:hypothetical protein